MGENSITVTKFNINNKSVYVKCNWKITENSMFLIEVYNEESVWNGRYSHEFAKKYMENFDGTEEQYYDSVKNALTGADDTFTYEFSCLLGVPNTWKFVWKKTFEDGGEFVYGAVPVHLAENLSTFSLLDYLLQENKNLKTTISMFEVKHKSLIDDLDKCHQCLETYSTSKDDLESHLYGKFLQLLNSKKRRIDILETCIQNYADGYEEGNDVD